VIEFRRLTKLYIPCLTGLLFLLTLGASRAAADTCAPPACTSFDLNVPNSGISGVSGPYANVVVTWTSPTTATITVTAYPGFLSADGSTVGFNINGTANVIAASYNQLGGFSSPWGTYGHTTYPSYGSGNVDGFGSFNFTMDDHDGYTHGVTSVTFTLTANGDTTWASASDVLTPNSGGSTVVAHIFVCNNTPCTESGGASVTGFASNGTPIPEPASIALFGSGLIALAGLVRRRRK
jgi:hypothetical protein